MGLLALTVRALVTIAADGAHKADLRHLTTNPLDLLEALTAAKTLSRVRANAQTTRRPKFHAKTARGRITQQLPQT
jgi:hypothetical protein